MRMLRHSRRLPALSILIAGAAVSLAAPVLTTSAAASAGAARSPAHTAAAQSPAAHPFAAAYPHGVRANKIGSLDCNGFSGIQKPVKNDMVCADPFGSEHGRFLDHGHYIGHDEPSMRFLSSRPGSGNNFTITENLPRDPAALPTVRRPGHDVTHWFELTIAPWFSTTVCDPDSAPLLPCRPNSDANAPHGRYPGGGAGFVELQFYAPGFAPFDDAIGCDDTHWCSALNIDSLECQGNGSGNCNNNCIEPVNFAYVQTNGVPAGPPSPQKSDHATFTPNAHTLLMNPGDKVTTHMWDAALPGGGHALEVKETDLTTGKSGFMIASARNGFMNTNPFDCTGTPFNFQTEYNTARPQNVIPWGIGPYMINTQYEIGHFVPCASVNTTGTFTDGSFKDTYYKHCVGPYETAPDGPKSFEPNDAPCYKKGDTHGGTVAPNLVTGCPVFFNAIGDLDYDGSPYWPDWPNSLKAGPFPSPFLQQQPTSAGHRYSQIQFMTDTSATEFNTNCNILTGSGCVLPPKGPGHFFPYFTQAEVGGKCVWEFGNMPNGNNFGKLKQYGKVTPHTMGAFAGAVRANPHC